jgi:hypothetical protein
LRDFDSLLLLCNSFVWGLRHEGIGKVGAVYVPVVAIELVLCKNYLFAFLVDGVY